MDNEPRPVHLIDRLEPRRVSTPILVVEDDPQLRIMFQLLLEGEGYPVVAAADGLEAVRAVRSMRPSLVILDLVTISDRHELCDVVRGRTHDGQAEEGTGAAAADLADAG